MMLKRQLDYGSVRPHWRWFIAAMLAVAGYLVWDVSTDHANIEQEEHARLSSHTRVVEQNLERQLIAVDRALKSAREDLEDLQARFGSYAAVNQRFQSITDAIPGVRSILLVNEKGICVASNRAELTGVNFREGERYQTMSRDPNPYQLFVSAPFHTPTGIVASGLGKVILDDKGAFSGYLLAILDPDFFSTLLSSVLYAPDMRASVIHADGKVIFRIPDPQGMIGTDIAKPGSLFLAHMQSGRAESVQQGAAFSDAEPRVTALRTLRMSAVLMDKPLVVAAGRSTSAMFAAWRNQSATKAALFGLLLLVGSGGLLLYQRRQSAFERIAARQDAERRQAEESLRQSEENLSVTLHSIGDAVIVTDAAGYITAMNPTAQKLTAWPSAEAKGQPLSAVFRIVDAESRVALSDPAHKVLEKGEIVGLANHAALIARDGREFQIADSAAPIRHPDGTISGVVLVFSDVTEKYRAQMALREREALLTAFSEHAKIGIIMVTKDHRYAFVNAAYARSHRRAAATMIGCHLSEVLGDLYTLRIRGVLDRAFAGEHVTDEFALAFPTHNSPQRHVAVSCEPPVQTSRGPCVIVMVTDITERKRAEAEQGQLAAIFEGTHDAIILRAPGDIIIGWNAAAERLLGWRKEEALGKKFRDLVSTTPSSGRRYRLENVLQGETLPLLEDTRKHKSGALVTVETTMSPVRDKGGHIVAVASIMRDITSRKRAEQFRNLLAAAIESSNNAIFIRRADRVVVYCNRMATQLFGYSAEDVLGTDLMFMVPPELRDERNESWSRLESGESVQNFETTRLRKDGTRLDVAISASIVKDEDGQAIGVATVMRDITERRRARAELEASRNQLQAALEAMSDAVFISDTHGQFVEFNEAFAKFYRFASKTDCVRTLGDLPGILELYSSDGGVLPLDQWAVPRALRGETGAGAEYTLHRKDTGERWIGSYTYAPIRDAQGTIVGAVVTGRDITDRKRSDLARARLAAIVEGSNDAIFSRSLDGMILTWNQGAEKMLGYAAEEVIGKPIDMILLPGHHPNRLRNNEAALKGESFVRESARMTKDGRTLWVRGSYSPLRDEAGRVTGISLMLQDITALKQAEAARTRLAAIVENSNDAIFSRTIDGIIVTWNKGAESMLGYTAEEVVGRHADCLLPPEHKSRMPQNNSAVLRGEGIVNDSVRMTKDKRVIYVRASYSPLRDQAGNINGVSVILQNVTALRQAESARRLLEVQLIEAQKMQAIGTLAGGIAHDFNNIIATIIGNAELARDDAVGNDSVLESVVEILKASARAKDLVQQILSFSRRQPTELKRIFLEPVVREAARLLRSTLPRRVSLDVQCATDVPPAMADATQIQQALINLSTNALHAMPNGSGRIRVVLECVVLDEALASTHAALRELHARHPGTVVRISVEDTGIGMDAATLKRIFEPFFTTKPVNEGTGLGLAVVHGIVQGHGGAVVAESEPGKGSTFSLYFPAARGDATDAGTDVDAIVGAKHVSAPGGLRVLYIDDDEMLVGLVARTLGRRGYQVSAHSSAREAIQLLRADPGAFDLILTDYNMPEMSGLDVAREAAVIRPSLPVVVTSGFIDDVLISQAKEAGVRELISKVDSAEELCATVQRLARHI